METWQDLLCSTIRQNKTFSLRDKENNVFKLMKYFVDDINIRKEILTWFSCTESNQPLFKKNIQKCEEFRAKGNSEFKNKNYHLSMKYYTRSLQFAPLESEDLSLAFANRSAALFYLEKYKDCIEDINLAIENNYPKNQLYKLHLRAAQCYSKLKQKNLVEESLNKLQECLKNSSIILSPKKEILDKQIENLSLDALSVRDDPSCSQKNFKLPELAFGENPKFSDASAALDLQFSIEKGRFVVANRDIYKGQVLFVEKPFSFVLLDNVDSESVCTNCCKSVGNIPIPCKFCASTLYCTVDCRDNGWSTYHQWECFGNQIGLLDQIGIAHLTIRTFLNCCYTEDKSKFNVIQNLVTNIDKISSNDMFIYGVSALMMALYFKKFTKFFTGVNIYEQLFLKFDSENELNMLPEPTEWTDDISFLYISGLLLRNMLQLICNGHAITRLSDSSYDSDFECRVATALYPSASMMNHSCDPNIMNSFIDQYLIVTATKNIPVNTEVFNCYGPHYLHMRKADRRMALQNQYCFFCECDACVVYK